jgi:hypothetical protein
VHYCYNTSSSRCLVFLNWVELLCGIYYSRNEGGVPTGIEPGPTVQQAGVLSIEPRCTLLSHAAPFGFCQARRHPIFTKTATISRGIMDAWVLGRLQLGHAKKGMVHLSNTVHRLWSGPPDYSPSPPPTPPRIRIGPEFFIFCGPDGFSRGLSYGGSPPTE